MKTGKGKGLFGAFVAVMIVCPAHGETVSDEPEALATHETLAWLEPTIPLKSINWGLLLEAEASMARSGSETESDLVLATVEFTLDAAVNDWLSGHLGLLWEENDTETNNLDEAYITLGQDFYVQAGRYYLPFGNFSSAFISDPVTLELAEINKSAAQVGYANDQFYLCAGVFRGEREDSLETFYASGGVAVGDNLEVGAYWLSDLLETDGLAGLAGDVNQTEGGAGAYVNVCLGAATLNAEWVSALDDYRVSSGNFCPMAYNFEASVAVDDRWTVGAKYEGSDDFYTEVAGGNLAGKFHKCGYGTVISCSVNAHTAISAEYLRTEDFEDGENGHLVTVQFAFEI